MPPLTPPVTPANAANVTATVEIDLLLRANVDAGRLPSFIAAATDRENMLYEGAFGYSDTETKTPLADDPIVQIASATKAMTSATALMLVADGALDLDAPISDYCPEASDIVVLEGWSAAGDPITRTPKTKVTIRHLLTHTSGLSYEFWNPDIPRYMEAKSIPSIGTLSRECLFSPLIAEPGTVWEYGISLDWMGVVIEAITGRDLEDHMRTVLFEPLGMSSTGFTLTADMSARLAKIHIRDDQGMLEPTDIIGEQNGDIKEGGGGVITTCREFCHFIQMVLNNGLWGGEQVMRPEVIDLMLAKASGDIPLRALKTVDPDASNDCEFFPGLEKSWSLAAMRMEETAPTGRSAGSIGWAGMFNTYYWIDPIAGLGGISTTQLLPFADPSAIDAAMSFETSVNALARV